jgi:hypothetical protein
MKIEIDVPEYDPYIGVRTEWKRGYKISARIEDGIVIIGANCAGLVSLAQHMLTLAQPQVPEGCHNHYDDLNSLESGSCEVIIEKIS